MPTFLEFTKTNGEKILINKANIHLIEQGPYFSKLYIGETKNHIEINVNETYEEIYNAISNKGFAFVYKIK